MKTRRRTLVEPVDRAVDDSRFIGSVSRETWRVGSCTGATHRMWIVALAHVWSRCSSGGVQLVIWVRGCGLRWSVRLELPASRVVVVRLASRPDAGIGARTPPAQAGGMFNWRAPPRPSDRWVVRLSGGKRRAHVGRPSTAAYSASHSWMPAQVPVVGPRIPFELTLSPWHGFAARHL